MLLTPLRNQTLTHKDYHIVARILFSCQRANQREIGEIMGVDYSPFSVARKRFHLLAQRDKKVLGLMGRGQSKISQG